MVVTDGRPCPTCSPSVACPASHSARERGLSYRANNSRKEGGRVNVSVCVCIGGRGSPGPGPSVARPRQLSSVAR